MLKNNQILSKRIVAAWACYDWGTFAFSTVVITFIFAAYFTRQIAPTPIVGTKLWGYAMSLASIVIVILSPITGAIADHKGRRKTWLALFTLLIVIASALLWFAYPNAKSIHFTLGCVILGTIGIEIGQVFYNALIPNVAPPSYLGRISGWGWGCGYAGGLAALCISLFAFVKGQPSWLNTATAEHIRICGPVVALWITVFSLPLFVWVPDYPTTRVGLFKSISQGMTSLRSTLQTLPQQKNIFLFLVARMIYTDGLNTIFAFGGIYAAGTFGMNISGVIEFGIVMNVAAGLGAIVFAWADDLIGVKRTILCALFALLTLGTAIVFTRSVVMFWILASILSLFFGPVQSASRSLMTRLAPKEKITEMFGLYTISGKVTAFIGPFLLATMTAAFNSQRVGIASVIPFFVIGGVLLWFVKDPASNEADKIDAYPS